MDNSTRINALAERAPAGVWRHQGDRGNTTDTRIGGDPRAILNLAM